MLEKRVLNNNHNVPEGKPDVLGKLHTSGREGQAESPSTSGCCIDRWCRGSLRKGLEGQSCCHQGVMAGWSWGASSELPWGIAPLWILPAGHPLNFGGCVLRGQCRTQNMGHQIPKSPLYFVSASHPCWGLGAWESPSPLQLWGGTFSGSPHAALPFLWDPEMWSSAPPEGAP